MIRELFKSIVNGIKTHYKALLLLASIAVGIIVILNVGFLAVSNNPKTCTLCHYMKPYYEQWKDSRHNRFTCHKCHPGQPRFLISTLVKYATNTYNPRPRAEVRDESCLQKGCHQERLLHGKVPFKEDIIFNHSFHLGKLRRGKILHCTSCHSQIVVGKHIAVTERVCFLCHFKGARLGQAITGCPSCHEAPKEVVEYAGVSFSHESYLKIGVACNQCHLKVSEGTGEVPKERCHSCHVERLEEYGSSERLHTTHVTEHIIDCFACHTEILHGELRMVKSFGATCTDCHEQLHSIQKEMYMGESGKGVADTPSRMFAAQVSCSGCHTHAIEPSTRRSPAVALEVKRKTCVACHGAGYDRMLDDWLRAVKRMESELAPKLDKAKKIIARAERMGKNVSEERILLEEAKFNFDLIKEGKGAHNVEYAVKLAKAVDNKLDQIFSSLKRGYRPRPKDELLGTPDGYCTILCHARLGLPEKLPFEKTEFPHRDHVKKVGVACTSCHSPEKHKQRIISKSECMACHHQRQDIECGRCHPAQKEMYLGTAKGHGVTELPDIMAEDVDCSDCHDLSQKEQSIATIKQTCVSCHEEGYDQMLIEWYNTIRDSANRVRLLLADVEDNIKSAAEEGKDVTAVKKLVEDAKYNLQVVEEGKGVHNPEFAGELLSVAERRLNQALKGIRK